MLNSIEQYLGQVAEQIRWKQARASLIQELRGHLEDQQEDFIAKGMPPKEAVYATLEQMGDPVMVGEKLDRAHRPKPDIALLAVIGLLPALGVWYHWMLTGGVPAALMAPVVTVLLSMGLFVLSYFADFTILAHAPRSTFTALCLLAFLICRLASPVNGQSVYLRLGFGINLSVFSVLLLLPTAFAALLYQSRNGGYGRLALTASAALVPLAITALVPSSTMFFLLGIVFLTLLTAAIMRGYYHVNKRTALLALCGIVSMGAVVLAVCLFALRVSSAQRFMMLFSAKPMEGSLPSVLPRLLRASRLIGPGHPLDIAGFDASQTRQWIDWLSNDYMLTVLVYRFGYGILIPAAAALALITVRGLRAVHRQQSMLGYLTSLAVLLTFVLQCCLYILAGFGLFVLPPLMMPLLQPHFENTAPNLLLLGLMMSVFRNGEWASDEPQNRPHWLEYQDGKLVIHLKQRIGKSSL